jgi:hypothetical protein
VRFHQLVESRLRRERLLVCNVDAADALPDGVRALPWREFPAWIADVSRR